MEHKGATDDQLRADAFTLVCFMISSARGLLDEPKLYGPRRLVDATEKLLAFLEGADIYDPFWHELANRIRSGKAPMRGDEDYSREFLDSVMDTATQFLLEN